MQYTKNILFMMLVMLGTYCTHAQGYNRYLLMPYREGSLWGYCDTAGNVLIKPAYDGAGFFDKANHLGKVFLKGKIAYINNAGKLSTPFVDDIEFCRYGVVIVTDNKKMGIWRYGKLTVPIEYDKIIYIDDPNNSIGVGVAAMGIKNKQLYDIECLSGKATLYGNVVEDTERTPKTVLVPAYTDELKAAPFEQKAVAETIKKQVNNELKAAPFEQKAVAETIKKQVNKVVPVVNGAIQQPATIAAIAAIEGRNYVVDAGPYTLPTEAGVRNKEADSIKQVLKLDAAISLYTYNGSSAVEFFLAYKNHRVGYLRGKTYIKPTYQQLQPYIEGSTVWLLAQKEGKWGVLDENETIVFPFEYDAIEILQNNLCRTLKGEKFRLIQSMVTKRTLPNEYESLQLAKKILLSDWQNKYFNVYKVTINGKTGYMGENGIFYFKD